MTGCVLRFRASSQKDPTDLLHYRRLFEGVVREKVLRHSFCLSKLQSFYHSRQTLWEYPYSVSVAEAALLTEAEGRLWLGPTAEAFESTHVKIHGVFFRTELAEKNMTTQDSGIVATFSERHRSFLRFGKLQKIHTVNIGGQQHVILKVNFFRSVEYDRRRWVGNSGRCIFLATTHSFIFIE